MHSLIITALIAIFLCALYAKARQSSQLRYIGRYRFHPAIRQKLKTKHPTLSDGQLDSVFQALRDYFYICNRGQRRMVAMPSQIVDDAWHEFILFTRSYDLFCKKAFGRFLHHTPAEAMSSPTSAQDSIKRAWRLACIKEEINPKTPTHLPSLFALDAQLALSGGFIYSLYCIPGNGDYCASKIGCGGGCGGGGDSCSSDGGSGGDGGGCGGGCGGD